MENEVPFKVRLSNTMGRHLVATKELPAGRIIFEEAPLFVYSEFDDIDVDLDWTYPCICCYNIVNWKNVVYCPECQWTFCSNGCSQDHCHQKVCGILSHNKISLSQHSLKFLYLLRFEVLKQTEENKWKQIMKLVPKFAVVYPDYSAYIEAYSVEATDFLINSCHLDVSLDYIKKVINIFRVNSFSFTKDKSYKCLYGTCCLLAHSCAPNSDWFILPEGPETGTMSILCRRDISSGESVTIWYISNFIRKGTRRRQISTLDRLCFKCECARCTDPSELNTFYSALKCSGCVDGWLLPSCQENISKCNQCSVSWTSAEVETIESTFRKKLVKLKANRDRMFWKKKSELQSLDNLIQNATSEHKLHPNHSLVFLATERWLTLQGLNVLLKQKAKCQLIYEKILIRAKRNLDVMKTIGTSDKIVGYEAVITGALIRYNFRTTDYVKIEKDIKNIHDKIEIISQVVTHLREAIHSAELTHKLKGDTSAIVRKMQNAYPIWEKRFNECILLAELKISPL